MRGAEPTIADIELDLNDLVIPSNLLSEEVLQDENSEEELVPYHIDTCCVQCQTGIRLTIYAVEFALRLLESLLLDEKLLLCCPGCARQSRRNGRP
ncbi:early protein E7 [Human papillomavirus 158]|uniref:Protein E7 n=2 Tax=Papillomaviridae TaxID=151340 RepID=A0A385PJ87_9PAPI|nr:early protein E7 [Human papillomavirus 158]AYA93965.1 MAG: E7 protein [Human papillomavirus]